MENKTIENSQAFAVNQNADFNDSFSVVELEERLEMTAATAASDRCIIITDDVQL